MKFTKYILPPSLAFIGLLQCSASLAQTIEAGQFNAAMAMIEEGANVHGGDQCFTPLMMAAWRSQHQIVEKLLRRGARANARSRECELELRDGYARRKYRHAARTALDAVANVRIARQLMDAGADPRVGGYRQYTDSTYWENGLVNAVRNRNLPLAQTLVDAGAPVHQYRALRRTETEHYAANRLLSLLWRDQSPEGIEMRTYLESQGAAEATAEEVAESDAMVYREYRHVPSGAITTMSAALAKRVHANPNRFAPITFEAGSRRFFHYAEFEWVANGMNMHHWYVLRQVRTAGPR